MNIWRMKHRCGVVTLRRTSSSSYRNHAPLSLLWLAFLAVAAGPAACFVMPSSFCIRGTSFFAAAYPMPRVVSEPQSLVVCSRSRGNSANESSSSGQRKSLYARVRDRRGGGGDRYGDSDWKDEECDQRGVAGSDSGSATLSCTRNARGFRAVRALTAGKGLRAAAAALRASTTEIDPGSTVSWTGSSPKRILILMSDTGGGHRASSQALASAMEKLYGDQVEHIVPDG